MSENPYFQVSVHFPNPKWYFVHDFARFSYSIRPHSKVYEKHMFSVTEINRDQPPRLQIKC